MEFLFNENTMGVPENYMDRWIVSFTQSLIKFVRAEMAGEQKNVNCRTIELCEWSEDTVVVRLVELLGCHWEELCEINCKQSEDFCTTEFLLFSVPFVHGGASLGEVRRPTDQLVRQDEPTPRQGRGRRRRL